MEGHPEKEVYVGHAADSTYSQNRPERVCMEQHNIH